MKIINKGFSLYPEHFNINETKKYIDVCIDKGFNSVFMSFIHFDINDKNIMDKYIEIIEYLKNKVYLTVDINEKTIDEFGTFKKLIKWSVNNNVYCLRLDNPMTPQNIADLTINYHNQIKFQINASYNDHFVDNILDYKPNINNLEGFHNFYPLQYSGLDIEQFITCNMKFKNNYMEVGAFVGSKVGTAGPQNEKVSPLVSVEKCRFIPIYNQIKLLKATKSVDNIVVGNQPMSTEEMEDFLKGFNEEKISFDLNLRKEKISIDEYNSLKFDNHFRRGDINENFIRSTMMRAAKKFDIKPLEANKKIFKRGDVGIINNNNKHYAGELIVFLKEYNNMENSINYVGKINENDYELINFIEPWTKFKFNI